MEDIQTYSNTLKRKKKRMSCYQRARKFSKRGKFGHGFQIEEDDFQYFLNILKVSNETFESQEDRLLFVGNVFKQLDGNEINYCSNQVVSRIVDNLLPEASDEIIIKIINKFDEELRLICNDQFASHVLQQLLHVATSRGYALNNTPEKVIYINWITKLCKFVLNNLEEFIWDTYANHIVRSCIACLCGRPYLSSKLSDQKGDVIETNKEHRKILKKYGDYIINSSQLSEMLASDIISGLLQVLLKCIGVVSKKRLKVLIEKIMNTCVIKDNSGSSITILQILDNSSISRLLDVVIEEAPCEVKKTIYKKYFDKAFEELSVHHNGNFSIQKILATTTDSTQFEAMFDKLKSKMSEIINKGYTGVLLEMSSACLRLKCKQTLFYQLLCEMLKCKEETDNGTSILLILGLKLFENYDFTNKEAPVHIHGSMIVQNLLKFNKPIKIVNNLLNLHIDNLIHIFCDVKGSYLGNAYFESIFIGEKSREKMLRKLKGHYTTLAISKSGSRVFDSLWKVADLKYRTSIMTELLKHESQLSSTMSGSIIISKVDLRMFRHNKDNWVKVEQDKVNTMKVFEELK
ncbi:nucleolar protein 9 [Daktulosphaira vitifoliae]|uniref:nucleolar protein 9 n=1 Tax=Daktulosphaira vitifoliae TaxID=58002 RepID=UPI0021A9FEE9|nr:nucleolar protein 9 [Daktulosphaira vitifoliae]